MKFRVDRDALADAVAWSARSLPSRPAFPLLAGLMISVDDSTLTVSGFDYEVSTEAALDAATDAAGRVLVSGRLLAEITRSLPAQPVEMHTDGARAVLTCGSARFELPTMAVADYPELPVMPTLAGKIGSDVFGAAVASVVVAAGRDDTLPVLTGVKLTISGDQLTLAATDRYRLAIRTLPWEPADDLGTATALVPARTLAESAKALTGGAHVSIAFEGNADLAGKADMARVAEGTVGGNGLVGSGLIGFEGSRRRTTTRLLDGDFPKYQSLLPSESAATARLEKAALVEAVRRVALVAQRTAPVRLSFDTSEVTLEAGGVDEAQATESLAAAYEGEAMTIAFNPSFLLDGLGALDSDDVTLAFTTPTKPAVLTGKDPEIYRYLLMPVRLTG
jgi:DNA polymerase III subunit beta